MKSKSTKNYKLPKSFIVRIYCFTGDGPEGIVGVVESVGNGEEKGFTGIEELWAILKRPGNNSSFSK